MRHRIASLAAAGIFAAVPAARAQEAEAPPADDAATRGAYVLAAAGCAECHTQKGEGAAALAGGRALATPFGTFHTPNITPDPETGLGNWTEEDFRRALREGRSPSGDAYFPAFPYTSYTGMTDADIADLWAYLRTVEPAAQPNRAHELSAPFSWRWLLPFWRTLYFTEGPPLVPVGRSAEWYRGAYLVEVMGHCGECHTPRDLLGGRDDALHLAGNPVAPEGEGKIPNITPDPATGIGDWSEGDIRYFLADGMFPDGDFAGGAMAEVIRSSTGRLTDQDRSAIATYLKGIPAIENEVE